MTKRSKLLCNYWLICFFACLLLFLADLDQYLFFYVTKTSKFMLPLVRQTSYSGAKKKQKITSFVFLVLPSNSLSCTHSVQQHKKNKIFEINKTTTLSLCHFNICLRN